MINLLRRLFGSGGRDTRGAPRSAAAALGVGAGQPMPAFRPLEDVQTTRTETTAAAPAFGTRGSGTETRLADAFTPTQPRGLGPLFIGRDTYLRRMIAAVEQERAHIILFGERGRGKTSLANGFAVLAEEAGLLTVRRACGSSTTYESLFRGLLAEIAGRMVSSPVHVATAADLLPEGSFGADQVCEILGRLRGGRIVLVIDEFDRARNERLRSEIAETIKNLSDQASDATLLLVGVAASLKDLLGRQPSIQRAILAMPLPPMREADVAKIVAAGAEAAGLEFEPPAVALIVSLSRGMPYYAHLLSLFAARAMEARGGDRHVTRDDVLSAAAEAIHKQAAEIEPAWNKVLAIPKAEAALLAAALAPFDDDGRVALDALPADLHPVLTALWEAKGHPVLVRRDDPAGPRISFALPAIAHQALLRAACDGRLPEKGTETSTDSSGRSDGKKDPASVAA